VRMAIKSEAGLAALAGRLALELVPPLEVALVGPLGAGKTTLVRHFCEQKGVPEPVSSPSFVLEHEYSLPGALTLEHWDLYRLADLPEELGEPPGQHVIRFVEWADRAPELLRRADLLIRIEMESPDSPQARRISLQGKIPDLVKRDG